MRLAMRTMTMAAGMRQILRFTTGDATHLHLRAQRGAARLEGGQRALLAGQKMRTMRCQEGVFESRDHIGKTVHFTCPQPTWMLPIKALMRSMADAVLAWVRWV